MPTSAAPRRLLIVRDGESLPTASVEFFLCRAVVQAAATDDVEYVCLRAADGTYDWIDTTDDTLVLRLVDELADEASERELLELRIAKIETALLLTFEIDLGDDDWLNAR